jgi:hypothetical protein
MARTFTGTNSLNAGSLAQPTALSVCAWVRNPGVSGTAPRIANHGSRWFLYYSGGGGSSVLFQRDYDATDGIWQVGSATHNMTLADWNHIAWTHDGGTGQPTCYINGVAVAVTTNQAPSGTIVTTSTGLIVGNTSANDRPLGGTLAHVAMHNVVLTRGEVLEHMLAGHTPRGSVRSYPLWGVDSPEIDLSPNSALGTLSGTAFAAGPPLRAFLLAHQPWAAAIAPAGRTITSAGIASGEAFGVPSVAGSSLVGPSGIPSEEAFGVPSVTASQLINPAGIASEEAFGVPLLSGGTTATVFVAARMRSPAPSGRVQSPGSTRR